MSKKNLKLLIILLALIGIAYLYQGPFKDWQKNSESPDNFLSDVDLGDVDKIEIDRVDGSSTLIKEGDKWKVEIAGDFYVSPTLSENLEKTLKDAKSSDFELASNNPDKKNEFKTDDTGINIKLYESGDLSEEFIVGALGPSFLKTYISKPGIEETYLVNANLFGAFSIKDWRDKTIFKSDKSLIDKVRFQYPNQEFVIEKKNDEWSSGDEGLDVEKVDEVLDIMSNLNAVKIPEQKFEGTGLEKNLIIIEASGDAIDNVIMVGEANEAGQYYIKRGDSDNIYLITEAQKNKLDRNINDLK